MVTCSLSNSGASLLTNWPGLRRRGIVSMYRVPWHYQMSEAGVDTIRKAHVVQANRVLTNHPGGEPSQINSVPLAGGIVVVSTANVSVFPGFYGGVAEHNIISNNVILDNQPFDLVNDGLGTGNHFTSNRCETSLPAWLCR